MVAKMLCPCLILITCLRSLAAEELVTDRPDQTESPVTVRPGKVQVEMGTTYASDTDGNESLSLPETLVRLGLSQRLELRLGWSGFEHSFEDEADKGGDGELGLKVRLWDEAGWRPEAALLAGVSLPVGSNESTSSRLDPGFRFSFAHGLSDRVSLGYNIGAEWASDGDGSGDLDTLASAIYTCTLGFGVSDRVGVFAELFGEVPLNAEGDPAHSFDGGMTVLLRDNVQWDMAAGVGLNDEADDWFVSTGISVRFGDED